MRIALIPARSGSKGVKNKNIKLLGGHPLMAWSIICARMAQLEPVVSTDSAEYEEIALKYGASVIIRPPELCTDKASDYGYIEHFLEMYPACTTIVLLRPTTPLRDPFVVARAPFDKSVRSVHQAPEPADKMLVIRDGLLEGFTRSVDGANLPRQLYTPTYKPNGYVDIIQKKNVKDNLLFGNECYPYITPDVGEIDTKQEFEYIEWRLKKYGNPILGLLNSIRA